MYKLIYMVFGYLFMGLGIAGFYLPLLPGVLFLILAAYCFMRSSPKYYNQIINNKLYGLYVKNFIEHKIIPKKIKFIIIFFIWSFTSLSIFYFFNSNTIISKLLILLIPIISTITVISANNE